MKKIIISGGGTGGHIFPAIAIANSLEAKYKNIDILFVGAEGKMEMDKVPKEGFKIIGLPIIGLPRKINFKIFTFFFKLFKSFFKAKKIINDFKPDICIGVGGYASGTILFLANLKKIPTVIQEQNSYAGITNKILSKKAKKIFVSYDKMDRFFSKEKIIKTGNPIRNNLISIKNKTQEALDFWNLDKNKKVILIMGGSGGAKQINESVINNLELISKNKDIFVILQAGKFYFDNVKKRIKKNYEKNILVLDFIKEMNFAYSVADLIIARAGAMTISELTVIGKPTILVPSPNVAEDHQNENAMALVEKKASILVKDKEAKKKLIPTAFEILKDKKRMELLKKNISKMAYLNSTEKIVNEISKIL